MENRKNLEYTCPSHGGWGMVRTGMLVPDSYQLFVCPSACGRHGALGAVKQGLKNRLCYLYLEESDIISGYDNAIIEAAGEMFERLGFRPKVLFVFVSCLDDLIGTDCDAVIDELSMLYPDVQFRMCHMNPISGESEEPPQKGIWKNMYSLLERSEDMPRRRVNTLGNLRAVHSESELHTFLQCLGIEKVCQVDACDSYEEFRDMGNNCLNLVVSSQADRAAQLLKRKENMEYMDALISYDFDEIEETYDAIVRKLQELQIVGENELPKQAKDVLEQSRKKAQEAILTAKEKVGEKSISLDYSAFFRPLKAARFLLKQGFCIDGIYMKDIDTEDEDYRWFTENTDIPIIKVNGADMVNKWKTNGEGIAIGMEAAYVTGSEHVVVMFQDEEMYGYHGVCRLMKMLCDCLEEKTDLEQTIQRIGLVV